MEGSIMAETTQQAPGKLQKLLDLAEAARKQREKAPMTGVGGDIRIPQKDIIARFTQDQGGKNDAKDGYHYLFVPEERLTEFAARGYDPVIEDGDVVPYQTDRLMRIHTKFLNEELEANAARSQRMLRSSIAEDDNSASSRGVGKETTRVVQTGPRVNRAVKEQ